MIAERGLALEWIEATLADPDKASQDPADPAITRTWKRIPEAGGRVMRLSIGKWTTISW